MTMYVTGLPKEFLIDLLSTGNLAVNLAVDTRVGLYVLHPSRPPMLYNFKTLEWETLSYGEDAEEDGQTPAAE
jgi:hypothetical protein